MLQISRCLCLSRLLRTAHIPHVIAAAAFASPLTEPRNWLGECTEISLQYRREFHLGLALTKYKKSHDEATDDEHENDAEFKDERDSKVMKANVNSLRADLLLKAGLGMARNKVESVFYDSKIRVNGKKLSKKSVQLNVGDEIDVIRGYSQANPSHLIVARVIILDASEREAGLNVALRRYKSLIIENYKGINAFKSSEVSDH